MLPNIAKLINTPMLTMSFFKPYLSIYRPPVSLTAPNAISPEPMTEVRTLA